MSERRLLGGRYELDGVIGRGGTAEVYRARDVRLDRIVAVKTLRDDLADDQTFQARFRREAQSAASLSHSSIVAVYDTGEDMMGEVPVPYIVMEYANGRTLADLLGEGRRLLPGRALEITEGVLRALAHSHRNGIVHRDIKPSNVMVTPRSAVKVMDFGIARSLGRSQATLTQTAQVIGTAQYMSPEQARGERVDARSDLYSAGCLLYELLTGRPPFRADSPVAIAYQHVREAPLPPSQLDPQIPRWADAVVLKAMAKAPAHRYQSAEEMRADIRHAMSGARASPPPAKILPSTQQLGPPVAGTPPATPIAGRSYGTGTPPPGHRRRRAVPWMLSAVLVLAAVIAAAHIVLATGSGNRYAVPDVRGLTTQQAGQEIIADRLQPHFLSQSSPAVPKGQVIGTSPAAGAMAPAGSTVTVYVSAGPYQRAVPDVVGQDVSAARSEIVNAGLNPVVKTDTASAAHANAADGLTNREIGRGLYLSHRTISVYLDRVFPKLGITSRAELRSVLDGGIPGRARAPAPYLRAGQ
jgi:tRNA A-37 threonylcarbamoyl transferase component Bud32/DNA-binding CsgD family transcriptional regulator